MWIRQARCAQARMPSMRPASLNPRAPAVVSAAPAAALVLRPTPGAEPASGVARPEPADDDAPAAKAGGFHESSYELQHGLQITESEWPDDVTVPGALGER